MMPDFGGLIEALMLIAAFALFAVLAGIGLALWSIWLAITVPQALVVMAIFGVSGSAFARWSLSR